MSDRRTHTRAPLEIRVIQDREDDFVANLTADVSKGGLFIRTSTPSPIGSEFSVVCRIPNVSEALLVRVRVEWVRAGDEPGMGCRFLFEDDEHRAAVENALSDLSG